VANERVSPTAHYTGYIWFRHGLSSEAFATDEGRRLDAIMRPVTLASRAVGGPSLEGVLLARHRLIDHRLTQAIADGRVGQVLEIAAGLSPRGWRFSRAHPSLTYVEADLPGMAARKREVLARAGAAHKVIEIDALTESGPNSLDEVLGALDPARGVAVVTEGLVHYLPRVALLGMWARLARGLRRFPHGMYLADFHLRDEAPGLAKLFIPLLKTFVRGNVDLQFADEAELLREIRAAGFTEAQLLRPQDFEAQIGPPVDAGARLVAVLEARTS
jgi:O-methyltransferase involved in polyketide biosynthesis